MTRILLVVIGLAVLLAAARYGLQSRASEQPESAPHRQLQNVREAATRIEQDAQQRADDTFKRTGEQSAQ